MKKKNTLLAIACTALLGLPEAAAQQPLRLSQADCREMALQHSEALQKADNARKQAELDQGIARAAYLPKIDASATGTYLFPDMDMMGMELRMRGTYMAGINLTQPLYAGGQITAGQRLARIGQESAGEQFRMTRMDVLAEADKAYWTYIATCRKVRMMESYHAQMDTLLRQTEAARAAGMATDNDLLRIEAKRTEVDYQLQKVKSGADLCRMSLCQAIGADFDTPIEAADTVLVLAAPAALAADISLRPELRLLEKQVDAGKEQVRMARAGMLPTVGLTAGYMYYGNIKLNGLAAAGDGTMLPFSQEYRDGLGMVTLAVQVPLFSWGENRKKVRKAQLDLRNARLDLQRNTRLLGIEAQQASHNVHDGYRLVLTAEKGVQQAAENLRVMRNRYGAAMSPLTDLLDAQSQWQQAESNLIEAQTQYKIYESEYLRATGRLE